LNGEDEAKRKLAELLKGTHKKRDELSEEKEPRTVEEALSKKQGDERYLLDERGSVKKSHLEEPIRRIIETFPGERVHINDVGGYYTVDYVEDALQEVGDTLCGGALGTYLKGQGVGNLPAYLKLALRDTGVKRGNSNRSTAGDQVITGVGFEPSVIIFLAVDMSGTNINLSWGFDTGTSKGGTAIRYDGTQNYLMIGSSIYIARDAGNYLFGYVTALSSDGFTIRWTLNGVVGLNFQYLCLP
jgi:hypothetical protein